MPNAPELWLSLYPRPQRDGHKYDRGSALIYGGEVMTGAARLAARAAQRIGAGLVTVGAPKKSLPIYAEALESAIVHEVDAEGAWLNLLADEKRNAILVGPGMGHGDLQMRVVIDALDSRKPCVLDADALTIFAGNPENLFTKLHANCVITPHEGEFAQLFQVEGVTKRDRALAAAKKAGCVVLLKGADTIIAAPDGNAVINDNGPPWLATAGSGDVLAGLILGLVAQKMPVYAATCAGAWIHGEIANRFGPGLIAEDLVTGVPGVVRTLVQPV